jgi:hypothetical protein
MQRSWETWLRQLDFNLIDALGGEADTGFVAKACAV